jgi:hypothetical protein
MTGFQVLTQYHIPDQQSAEFARDVQLFLTHSLDTSTKDRGQTTHLDALHTSQHLRRDRNSPLDGLKPNSLARHDKADGDHRADDGDCIETKLVYIPRKLQQKLTNSCSDGNKTRQTKLTS